MYPSLSEVKGRIKESTNISKSASTELGSLSIEFISFEINGHFYNQKDLY